MEYQKVLLSENPYFISCVYCSYQMHIHSEIELLYCIQGEAKVIIENEEYSLQEGTVLLINPFDAHQLINDDEATILALRFGSQFLGAEYKDFSMQKFINCPITPHTECPYKNYLLTPLKRLYEEHIKHEIGSTWAIKGLLYDIFAMIVRYVPIEQQDSPKLNNMDRYLKIQKAFDLVHKEYAEDITLERVAEVLGYNKRSFCRVFKYVTNMTFHEYLNSYRIDVSMRLLEHNVHSIGEIGQMVGIPVAKSFGRIFRKYVGMSPKEYRAMCLQKD